jgi:hypothetical protein
MFRLRTVVTLAIGFGAGYVAGTRAGRPAYERLVASVGMVTDQVGLSRPSAAGPTSTEATNDELARLREPATVGTPRMPDEGRAHAATATPTPRR